MSERISRFIAKAIILTIMALSAFGLGLMLGRVLAWMVERVG